MNKNIDDDKKLYKKYINKKHNAKKEGVECFLTFEEYCQLVEDAGLVSSQLGFTGENYVLARYKDSGNYTIDNCRFITQAENMKEQKISEKSHLATQNNVQKAIKTNQEKTFEEKSNRIKNSVKWQKYNKKRKEQAKINQKKREDQKDKRYIKEHNSQYGTYWITNGVINKKWKNEKGSLPEGFYKGRVI